MAKFQSPLLGYNNNVRYKNRVFHIQTEDSGVQHPHVITHLFMDGGRILKSFKKSYAEHVGSDGLSDIVRQLMKEQHKAMFIALREGQFDHMVDPGAASTRDPGPKPASPKTEATTAAKPADPKPAVAEPSVEAATPEPVTPEPVTTRAASSERNVEAAEPAAPEPAGAPADDRPAREMPRAPAIRPKTVPSMPSMMRSKSADTLSAAGAKLEKKPEPLAPIRPAAKHPTPSPLHAAAPPRLMLDLEHPESSTDVTAEARDNELPPPLNTFAKSPTAGAYRTSDTSAKHQIEHVPMPPQKPTAKRPSSKPPPEGRYAPARPASIFESTTKPSSSIFSDDLINDKSLDEVILSYLAEDLDPPRRK